jgi:cell division protein FtsB
MGWFSPKKTDPLSERARTLSAEIAALEAQIRHLETRPPDAQTPRLRSTARPRGPAPPPAPEPDPAREPVFEQVDHDRVKGNGESAETPEHFNALGVRKFDLAAAWRRLHGHFHGPATNNPKLINYLAAGSIHGLRPMRYEKRVARRRVIFLTVILVLVLWGLIAGVLKL